MPKILSPAEASALGLDDQPGSKVLSPEQAKDLGLDGPSAADSEDLGGRVKEGDLKNNAATGGMLGALNGAALGGMSNVLALEDAVRGIDSAKKSGSKTLPATQGFEQLPLGQRYRINKDFYEAGYKRLKDANPVSTTVGEIAPSLLSGPGGGLKGLAKAGAVYGGASALVGGPSKVLGGDDSPLDAVKDVGEGMLTGGAAGLAGGALGAGLAKGGQMAAREFGGVMRGVHVGAKEAAESAAGKAAQEIGDFAGAGHNVAEAEQRLGQVKALRGAGGSAPPGQVPKVNPGTKVSPGSSLTAQGDAAQIRLDRARELLAKGRPSMPDKQAIYEASKARAIAALNKPKLRDVAGKAALGFGTGLAIDKGSEALGVDPGVAKGLAVAGGAAVLGGPAALKQMVTTLARKPENLQKLMKLRTVGPIISRLGGRLSNAATLETTLYALGRHNPEARREMQAVLEDEEPTESEADSESEDTTQ